MSLSLEYIQDILKCHLDDTEFEYISCENVKSDSDSMLGFLSIQNRSLIKYKHKNGIEELSIFVKTLPSSPYHMKLVKNLQAFTKEVVIYETFLNVLRQRNIIRGNETPICYLAKNNEILVFNDLISKGFRNIPVLQTYSAEHIEKAIESIAKLHAGSLIFEKQNNIKIQEHLQFLTSQTIFSDIPNNMARKAVIVGLDVLREIKKQYLPEYSDELTDRVFDYLTILYKFMGPNPKYPNVFSHGDLWSSNMMFSYDEKKIIKDCCLIDFQMSGLKPLTYDLQMLIFICASTELQDTHYDHFVKFYYEKLSESLSIQNIDLSTILPYNKYEECLKETEPVLLALAPQFLHFVAMPEEILQDVINDDEKYQYFYEEDRTSYALKAISISPAYKARVLKSLKKFFEYCKENNFQY